MLRERSPPRSRRSASTAARSTTTPSGRSSTSSSRRASTGSSRSGRPAKGSSCASRSVASVADLFLQASDKRLQVAVHCGAQTTADTVTLAAHAAEVGADAVVVIGPPYFKLDEKAQYAPLPRRRDGLRSAAVLRLRVRGDDGLRRSRPPCSSVFATTRRTSSVSRSRTRRWRRSRSTCCRASTSSSGPEALIADGMARGARGAVSALASALPREVAAVVRDPTPRGSGAARRAARLRGALPAAGRAQAPARAPGSAGHARMCARRFARSRSRSATSSTRGQHEC